MKYDTGGRRQDDVPCTYWLLSIILLYILFSALIDGTTISHYGMKCGKNENNNNNDKLTINR